MPDFIHIEESPLVSDRAALVEEIYALVGNPISVWAVAAAIESLGIRDVDAQQDFEASSVFELAEYVHTEVKKKVRDSVADKEEASTSLQKPPLKKRFWMFLKYYSKGILFSLPVVSQVAAILIFHYSLWAWLYFNTAQATVVAFGTIVAFVVTGGFIQTLGRSVTKYMSEENYALAFIAVKKIINAGLLTTALVAAFFFLLNIIIPFYPQPMLWLALVYYVLLSVLVLASGVLYALEQRLMILCIFVAGTCVVIVCMEFFNWGIYISQWTGLVATIALLAVYGYLYLRLKVRFARQDMDRQSLPAAEVRYYINYRYFVYGFCYFLFLFMDRILAWSAGPPPPPYIVWFNTPYELGMDWALISLILSVAVLEYSVNAFSLSLLPLQKGAMYSRLKNFNDYFKRFYWRQLVLLVIVGSISIIVTFFGINSLRSLEERIPEIRDFFANPMTIKVFWIASISYLFVIIGLLHALFFFTLHRPSFAMWPMITGVAVNFVVGYICSRVFALEYATIGLAAGAVTFALMSGWIARAFFKRLDYYYYSAF